MGCTYFGSDSCSGEDEYGDRFYLPAQLIWVLDFCLRYRNCNTGGRRKIRTENNSILFLFMAIIIISFSLIYLLRPEIPDGKSGRNLTLFFFINFCFFCYLVFLFQMFFNASSPPFFRCSKLFRKNGILPLQ